MNPTASLIIIYPPDHLHDEWALPITLGVTLAFDLFTSPQLPSPIQVETVETAFGMFVTGIGGMMDSLYFGWQLRVNGNYDVPPPNCIMLKDGDEIMWTFTRVGTD